MADDIKYWTDITTTVVGQTPFGFFDTDANFQVDAVNFAHWCSRKLGYPVIDVELTEQNFYTAFEEAISEYSSIVNYYNILDNLLTLQGAPTSSALNNKLIKPNFSNIIHITDQYGTEAGAGGSVAWKSGSISVIASQQDYDLNEWARVNEPSSSIEIRRIFHKDLPAFHRFYDPFVGSGITPQYTIREFGWERLSPGINFMIMPIFEDLLRLQAIEFNQQIRKSGYSFELINNQLRIFPIPTVNFSMWFQYIIKEDKANPLQGNYDGKITDISDVPYNQVTYSSLNHPSKQWVFQYGFACAKEILGLVRSKYSGLPDPSNSNVSLDGDTLRSEASVLKDNLKENLKTMILETSKQKQLERKYNESEYARQMLSNVPLPIFIY